MYSFKKLILGMLLASAVFMIYYDGNSQTSRIRDGFYIGPINYFWVVGFNNPAQMNNYSSLHYNLMQSYSSHADTTIQGLSYDGGFFGSFSLFSNLVNATIEKWNTLTNKNSLIFERERVLRPAYGQRSTYQAEKNAGYWTSVFPSYGYTNNLKSRMAGDDYIDNTTFGNGVEVKRCLVNAHNVGFIVKGLIENCEQVNRNEKDSSNSSGWRMFSDLKQPSYNYKWYIKPRMRIDAAYALTHPEETVAVLYVNNFEDTLINTFTIKCKNFMQLNGGIWFYDGSYIEMFYQILDYPLNNTPTAFSVSADSLMMGRGTQGWDKSKVDYYIEWKGKVDTYLDYVRVDDEWAHYLFNAPAPDFKWQFHTKLNEEIDNFSNNNGFGYFWVDEFAYNNIPCVAEVNRLIRQRNPNTSIIIPANIDGIVVEKSGLRRTTGYNRLALISKLKNDGVLTNIYLDVSYPFASYVLYPYNLNLTTPPFPIFDNMQKASSNEEYNCSEAQSHYGIQYVLQNWMLNSAKENRIKVNEIGDLTYGYMIQVHSDELGVSNNPPSWAIREPTNEEIRVQSYLGLALGAKIITQYSYYSYNYPNTQYYSRGLYDFYQRRDLNYYGQRKFDSVSVLNQKLRALADIMYPPDDIPKHLVYNKTASVNLYEFGSEYISDIKSGVLLPELNVTYEMINGESFDLGNKRFWEIGFFNPNTQNPDNANDKSKYFLAVNKRCAPSVGNTGDERILHIKFDAQKLQDFNNWKLIDVLTNTEIQTFNKNTTDYIIAGRFQPGEGRLFKLAPVMQEGGTFVCDELVTASAFNCNGTVNTGGYNLNIPATNGLTTISFAQNGTIQGYGGTDFIIGGYNQIVLQGQNGNKWRGLEIDNCANINIHNTKIKDIGDVAPSSYWALSIYDCPSVEISSCNFELPPQAKGININNFSAEETAVAIMNNNISVSNSTAAIFVGCSSFGYRHLFLMDNVITNNGTQSTFGVLLNNVFSWYADRNTITGFEIGMKLLNSTLDMYGNSITSVGGNNTAILATSSSTVNIGLIGNYYIEGHNTFSNYGDNSKNISLSNSVFEMNYGNNNLTVDNTAGCFNLVGNGNFTTSGDGPIKFIEAIGNCFNGEGNNAIDSITDLEGLRYTLNEDPHNCNIQQDRIADFTAPVINNIVDTVYRTTLPQYQNSSPSVALYRDLYKSVMKRNYDSTKILGTILLTNYSDSITTADVISLLYFANTKLADISTNMLTLKTFLEQLIINHPQNLTLVRTANYFVQKCKVHLQQFTSALDGYQDIIVQNPYSYEGLVASWDYASTLLLANSGGAYSNNEDESLNSFVLESQFLVDSLRMKRLMNTDKYDKKVFTQDDRKVLIKSVGDVLKDDRQKQIEKVKSLEEELNKSKGNNTSKAKQKLEEVKNLNSLIKTKRPKDAEEYKVIINNDIEKLYPKKSGSDSNPKITVPQTYALYQNYPNPFNPTTKIAYDIPRDAKVKLVIYDILGREMKTLVNNEFRSAGKYITEFNGSNLASGIYFARILVNEGKDFMAVKKMVLLK